MSIADVLRSRILSGLGLSKPSEGKRFVRRITVTVTVSIPANTKANASTPVNFIIDPKIGAVSSYTIPKGETWVLVDAYIKSSEDVGVDGICKLKRNFFEDHVVTPPVSTMLVSNPSRPAIAQKPWDEGDTLSGEFINTADVGTAGASVTFYLVFDIYK